jgi:hypothetical protein
MKAENIIGPVSIVEKPGTVLSWHSSQHAVRRPVCTDHESPEGIAEVEQGELPVGRRPVLCTVLSL